MFIQRLIRWVVRKIYPTCCMRIWILEFKFLYGFEKWEKMEIGEHTFISRGADKNI